MIKILIVDDEPIKAQLIRDDYLDGYDCTIDIATSYLTAVNKLRDNKYDLVISDENLPDEDNCLLGTGHGLKKAHLAEHPECRFILYTASPELIDNKNVKAECVPFDKLRNAIQNAIYLMSTPKTEDEKPQIVPMKNGEIMAAPQKFNWLALLPLAILIIGFIGGYKVMAYKVDSTDAKVSTHCAQDALYKEQVSKQFTCTEVATARLEEQTKALKEAINELTREIKRRNKQEPY